MEEDMQGKVMELSMMEGKLKQLDQQLSMIDQQITEDEKVAINLENLKVSGESETVLPLGGGLFAKGTLDKVDNVLVNIGAGLLVEKSIDEGKRAVEKRKNKLLEAKEELGKQIKEILVSMADIERTLKKQN